MREMQSADGGYYSTLDADSEGQEGRFYVWDREEVEKLLGDDEFRYFSLAYGLDRRPNFEGRWHLHTYRTAAEIASESGLDTDHVEEVLSTARARLLTARENRVRPGRDEKVLTAWNGLMIRGMAVAARHLQRDDLADSAARALDFLRGHLWTDHRLQACWKDGRARFPAYLDDYAFLLDGVLEMLQLRWRSDWLAFGISLADAMLAHFQDDEHGGFFFTADDQEALLYRPRPLADEALPAGNGVAAQALARLGYLTGEPRYLESAERTLAMAAGAIQQMPHAHCSLLNALEEQLFPPETIIIRGERDPAEEWRQAASLVYSPRRQVFAIPSDVQELPKALAAKVPASGTVAYVCRGTVCAEPVSSLPGLAELLRASF
jgi:uncharacterized protein YyaL (SSP411 family)